MLLLGISKDGGLRHASMYFKDPARLSMREREREE